MKAAVLLDYETNKYQEEQQQQQLCFQYLGKKTKGRKRERRLVRVNL